jgi:inhibitor of KinA sporulation pathway (predicted exonuclease)
LILLTDLCPRLFKAVQKEPSYIVFDLEATCWRLHNPPRQEIIEIGASKVSAYGEIISSFNSFIKPKQNPKLSSFCTQLTSITQADIDPAPDFQEVMWDFEDWLQSDKNDVVLLSWGDYDLKQLKMDAEIHEMQLSWTNQHFCLKEAHARLLKLREPVGVSTALEYGGLQFEGSKHRAIADAINTARILTMHFEDWDFIHQRKKK